MVLNGAAGRIRCAFCHDPCVLLRCTWCTVSRIIKGGIAAIMWFGLQCYAGSLACLILIGKIWPGFLTLGADFTC
ncbi:cytosine permease [Shigella flexneri]